MIDYATFTAFSQATVSQTDFPYIEARAVDILSLLCKDKWDAEDSTCIRAVCYQIEYIIENGGLVSWSKSEGSATSRSYSVGGESESYTLKDGKGSESVHYFMGLAISPLAWALLLNGGFIQTVKGVRVW